MGIPDTREEWPHTTWDAQGPFVLSDDPADHGLSSVEVACIEKAYELRRREVKRKLEKSSPYRLEGWLFGGGRPQGLKQWAVTIFVLPVVQLLIVVVGAVLVPFDYASHRRKVAKEKKELAEELESLERPPFLQRISEKTLWGIWRMYGFERDRFGEPVCIELAAAWIEQLYGADTLQAVRLEARLEEINRQRAKLRAKSPDIGCVLWIPRLHQVLQELSRELPPYDWAGRAEVPGAGRIGEGGRQRSVGRIAT